MHLKEFWVSGHAWSHLFLFGDPQITEAMLLCLTQSDLSVPIKSYGGLHETLDCIEVDRRHTPFLIPAIPITEVPHPDDLQAIGRAIWIGVRPTPNQVPDSAVVVECRYPNRMSDRIDILSHMLRHRNPHPGVINYMAEWCHNAEDMVNFIRLINTYTLNRDELEHLYPLRKPSLERLVLTSRIRDLIAEYNDAEQKITFLNRLHKILVKVYFWIEGHKVDSDRTEKTLLEESWEASYWRGVERRYSARVVRESLEECAEAYKLARLGMTALANSRAIQAIRILGE